MHYRTERAPLETPVKETLMLGPVAVCLVMVRDWRGLLTVGTLLLLIALVTLAWNLAP